MRLFIILFLLLIFLLLIPIKLKSKLVYNLICNRGYISVYFYNLRLFVAKWKFVPFKIFVTTKKKDISIYFSNLKKQNVYSDIFFSQLVKKMKINNFRNYTNIGINNNSMLTAISCGFVKIIIGVFSCFLINKKSISSLNSQIFANFNKSNFLFCLTGSAQINLILVIYCAVSSFFIKLIKE